jgi:site-specific DNA-methyltransferase (adenine-specific)
MAQHYYSDKQQPAVPTEQVFSRLRAHFDHVPAEIEELVRSRTIESENLKRRRVVGTKTVNAEYCFSGEHFGGPGTSGTSEVAITEPYSDAAKQWAGWGTALKPAHEPIVMARKPLIGTVAANVLKHRTGAINIDGCRVEGNRWPANVLHDGSDEVTEMFPAAKSSGKGESAARFFYCPKVSRSERGGSAHPTMKPIALMSYLCRLVTPPNGTVLDPFMGSGSTGLAALAEGFQFVGIERDPTYYQIAERRIHG